MQFILIFFAMLPLFCLETPEDTMPSEKMFSVILGHFPHDVSLRNVTIGGEPLSLVENVELGFKISFVSFNNGTHGYQLKVPFSHPLISQKVRPLPGPF